MSLGNDLERVTETGLFASRWLLTPFYIGLVGSLLLLMNSFVHEFIGFFSQLATISTNDTILAVLTLIDLTLAANLVIIVTFSGYENFVSKFDIDDHKDRPAWQGKVDFSGLKMKLVASIIAISSIHLLKVFMDVAKYDEKIIRWMVIIHVIFITSGVMLALMDRLMYSWRNNTTNN
ncbi:MAG: TIGR00645 family protein [Rickettsiales bacterium]|nr:TIGR00645 family protein [Rickettsiales bacterium]